MKYAQTLLAAVLLISGIFIWYSFYSTFQEKREESASPAISPPSQEGIEETEAPPSQEEVEETEGPSSVDQDKDEKVTISYIPQNGITQQMVNEWNIEDERISIDRLLSLLEKNKP
ncbi:hypothetical protein [Bacillus sp. CHD6a]|uniref:hypothetical protein n=1 Tax=Bacillus sp. CHD6a TaxID=1643452 RepID=UPI0006CDE354|nr:hypothetical protein [Bacillus sp. CHD6a]KPB05392.1 hypothetical protein AAV98_06540 [Bacillus sp. CHD6a]